MQISSRAWHLKLARFFDKRYVPRDLCSYFRQIVSIFFFIGVGVYLVSMFALALFILVKYFYVQIALGVGSAAILAVVIFATYKVRSRLHNRPKKTAKELKEPGLLRSWLKARKERYCPLIEVAEDTP